MTAADRSKLEQIGEQLGTSIVTFVREMAGGMVRVVKVVKVAEDEDGKYAEVELIEGNPPLRVPLRFLGGNDDTSICVTPKIDTTAAVIALEGDVSALYFAAFSEIDKIEVKVGNSTINVTSDKIEFNGGNNNGLVLVDKLTQRLTKLQNEINAIQAAIAAHTHLYAGGKTNTATYSSVTLSPIKNEDYENTKITQ